MADTSKLTFLMSNNLLNLNKAGELADFSWLATLENIFKKKFKLKKQISIALIGERDIKELNRVYRNKNKVTDVLSFNMDSDYILGEVLICPEQARRQAKEKSKTLSQIQSKSVGSGVERKNTYKAELQLLTTHGILHLLGYDHEKSIKEEKRQQTAEQNILAELNSAKGACLPVGRD